MIRIKTLVPYLFKELCYVGYLKEKRKCSHLGDFCRLANTGKRKLPYTSTTETCTFLTFLRISTSWPGTFHVDKAGLNSETHCSTFLYKVMWEQRHSSGVKSTWYSCWGHRLHMVTHKYLSLQVQGTQNPPPSSDIHRHTSGTQSYMQLKHKHT